MSTRVRVVGFVLALAVVFLAARGVGAAVPPVDPAPTCAAASADPSDGCADEHDEGHPQEQRDDH